MTEEYPTIAGELSEYCFTVIREKETVIVSGYPPCPECGRRLFRFFFEENKWKCPDCQTVWTGMELVDALRNQQALMEIEEGSGD